MALDSGTRLGPYEILDPVGSGGMGEVYRARDTRLDRVVAVKVLPTDTASPQALERFERESKAIAALNHPGICAVYDVGTSPVPYLVMELLDGETLHQRLLRGPIEVPALVEIGLVLADALASAHGKGIVHRDLKPANIVLTARGPKILDFGLARINEAASPNDGAAILRATLPTQASLTDAGVAVGTAAYMSPEQLRGDAIDARSDLFSLGLVLYEMATGRRAFSGATTAVTSAAILHEQPAAPRQLRPDLPPRLEQAIVTLLEKERDVRTQTASELRAELTRLKRELSGARAADTASPAASVAEASVSGGAAVGATAAPPSSSDAQLIAGVMRRHRGAVVSVATVILLLVLGATYFVTFRDRGAATSNADTGVSIANLKVEQLTTSGTADQPAISPDGKYVAYLERGAGGDSLRVRQVATASNVEIVPPDAGVFLRGPTVTPDGAFVNYVRQVASQPQELWQIPFLGGPARRLPPNGRVGFSDDGSQMAYLRDAGSGRTELMIAGIDGRGERVVAARRLPDVLWTSLAGTSFAPAWSPDGTTIAVLGGELGEPPTGQVVFVDVKTGAEQTANAGPSPLTGTGLAWLDDRSLLVSMLDKPSAPLQLWLLSYPERMFRRLTNDTSQYVGVSLTADRNALVTSRSEASFGIWTSDASASKWSQTVPTTPVKGPIGFRVRWIGDDLVYSDSASGGFALTRWRAATRTTETLAQGGGNPSVSHDGSTIVFFDYDSGELLKMDSAGTNRMLLRTGFAGAADAILTPDGRQLVSVETGDGNPSAVRIALADRSGTARDVTADRVRIEGGTAEVSPDGRWIAYPSFDDRKQPAIAVCDLATCSSRRTLPALATWQWMPDGQALAYIDPRTQSDLWVQPLDGGAPRRLTRFPADGRQIWSFAWSADGTRLAVARATMSNNIVMFRGLRTQK